FLEKGIGVEPRQAFIIHAYLEEVATQVASNTGASVSLPHFELRGEVVTPSGQTLIIDLPALGPVIAGKKRPAGGSGTPAPKTNEPKPAKSAGTEVVVLTPQQEQGVRDQFNDRNANNLHEEQASRPSRARSPHRPQ